MQNFHLDLACKAEIQELKIAICDMPESGSDYGCQAFGVFCLWYRLRGFDKNQPDPKEVIAMREYAVGVGRFGDAMQKKAGL